MAPAYPIRPVSQAEFTAFHAVIQHAFNATYPTDEELRHDQAVFEFDRSLAAFDGADLVGTAAVLTFRMSVPGDAAPVAGVTAVSVLPSHRRRGILSSLVHRQMADIRDRGEAVAVLFASEAGIYGRYGYGAATGELDLTIRRGEGVLSTQAPALGPGRAGSVPRLRIAAPRDATAELATIYAGVPESRPGLPARDARRASDAPRPPSASRPIVVRMRD